MMSRRRHCPSTAQLFDWTPPEPVTAFEPQRVKASSLANEVSRAISEALTDCANPREVIAQRMSDFLGMPVSLHMLDKYASEAAEDHIINIVRFIALTFATDDMRLLQLVAEKFDQIVVPRAYLTVIELAREEEIDRQRKKHIRTLRRTARSERVL